MADVDKSEFLEEPQEVHASSDSSDAASESADSFVAGLFKSRFNKMLSQEDLARFVPSRPGSVTPRARQLYAVEDMRRKSRNVAAVLAIFFGMFGLHKFYLGYNQPGFVLLAVTVIGGVVSYGVVSLIVWAIAAMEGVLYLSKSQPEFERIYVVNQRDWL